MEITTEEFNVLSEYIHRKSGICLPIEKKYLIQQRLMPIIKKLNLNSFMELYDRLAYSSNSNLEHEIIAAISTNETLFFRDDHPFETLHKHIFPKFCTNINGEDSQCKINILSIGCSTGQEPYSIAMAAHEYVQANCFISKIKIEDFNILGIDISSDVLLKAESAQYNDIEIKRGISDERKVKYFNKEGNDWIIKEKIRDIVEFRKINIVKSFMMLEGFHIIFCRNILIYFDRETKQNILKQLLNILTDKGILIIGASENLFCLSDNFESRSFGSTLFFEKKMEA